MVMVAATPALAGPVLYTFDVTSGSVALNLTWVAGQTMASTSGGLSGTFAVTIFQSNDHIGASDTFIVEDAGLTNTSTMKVVIAGLATGTLRVGSARFLDFNPQGPGHILGLANPVTVNTDVYLEATLFVTGMMTTTFTARTWADSLLPFQFAFKTSVAQSDTLIGRIGGKFGYEIGVTDVGLTLTLDLILGIEGTAHVVPDPALGGVTALGLGGAGAWLRRRRS